MCVLSSVLLVCAEISNKVCVCVRVCVCACVCLCVRVSVFVFAAAYLMALYGKTMKRQQNDSAISWEKLGI